MQQIGVEALVEGLSQFTSDIKSINSSLESTRQHGSMLSDVFDSVTGVIAGFGREILNIAEFALGHLLADAIEFAVTKIKELIGATIEAGSEFQTLELRLQRLNFNTLIESGMDYNKAQKEAIELTKEQLTWLQKLAAQTPYDAQDIANTYTLARTYGLVDDAAQGLTEDIVNFASGMGLGNQEIERIIINFGQMIQQGKVTQREMNDLARGSFVPVNDILNRMAKNLGMTTAELTEFRKTAASVPEFMKAFSQLVEERFSGAAEAMAKTFKGASANVLDLVKSIGGLNIVKPILDAIGERLASFTSAFTEDPRMWDRLTNAATEVGKAISAIVNDVLGLLPSTKTLAEGVVEGLAKIAGWIDLHRGDIVGFFKNIRDVILEEIVPFVQDKLIPAIGLFFGSIIDHKDDILGFFAEMGRTLIEDIIPFLRDVIIPKIAEFIGWITDNKDTILEFWGALSDIISTVATNLLGTANAGSLGDTILNVMKFVIDNKDKLADWLELIIKIVFWWQIFTAVIGVVAGVVSGIIGIFITVAATLGTVLTVLQIIKIAWTALSGPILAVAAALGIGVLPALLLVAAAIANVILWIAVFRTWWAEVVGGFTAASKSIPENIQYLRDFIVEKLAEIRDAFNAGDWVGVGQAIIEGIVQGIFLSKLLFLDVIRDMAIEAFEAVKDEWGIGSPSKLFRGAGEMAMLGMAEGIKGLTGMVAGTMENAMTQVAMPAMLMPEMAQSLATAAPSVTRTTNNNFNLNISSNAATEPIIQDFAMLQSMAGG